MHDAELLDYYTKGWIPAPQETASAFYKRIAAFQTLQTALRDLQEETLEPFPFSLEERAPLSLQKEAEDKTAAYYGTVLRGIPLFCSSKKLAPWQGAITWICTLESEGPPVTFIQLHSRFAKQPTLWGLYSRDELLTHELAHAGRAAFQETEFEELIAYSSAHSSWRRWLGPLFNTTREALFMMVLISGILCFEVFILLGRLYEAANLLFALWMLPLIGLFLLFSRLWQRQKRFHQAFVRLTEAFQDRKDPAQSARTLLYCLSDAQIHSLAKDFSVFTQMAQSKREDTSLHDRLIALLIQKKK